MADAKNNLERLINEEIKREELRIREEQLADKDRAFRRWHAYDRAASNIMYLAICGGLSDTDRILLKKLLEERDKIGEKAFKEIV